MPTPVLDRITDAQASVLDAVDQTRQPVVGAVKRVVTAGDRAVPNLAPTRQRIVPRVGTVIDTQLTFVIELLKRQRANTRAVVKAASTKGKAKSTTKAA